MVTIDEDFRKKYILFMNKLIEELNQRIVTFNLSIKATSDTNYIEYLNQKRNETLLQMDQLRQQIAKIKTCKIGERFKLSTVDGFVELSVGDPVFSAISPVILEVDDQKISRIID